MRIKRQEDLETDEAPDCEFPSLPSLPMHTQGGVYRPGAEAVTSEGKVSARTHSGMDSGYCTEATITDTSSTLSEFMDSLNLDTQPQRRPTGPFRSEPRLHRRVGQTIPQRSDSLKALNCGQMMNIVTLLRANPDMCLLQDEDGDTFLHLAVLHCHYVLVVLVLQSLISPELLSVKNTLSQTALHFAVLRRKPKIVRLLLVYGASVEDRDRNGNTALHLACRDGDLECVRQLTLPLTQEEKNLRPYRFDSPVLPQDPNIRNYHGDGCIHLAAANGHLDIVRYLIESSCRADVNYADGRSGRTILHNAVESRDMGLLSALLQHRYTFGLDLDAGTYCGSTALSLALGRTYRDIAEFLILAGADTGLVPCDILDILDNCSDSSSEGSTDSASESFTDFMESDEDDGYYDDFCYNGKPVSFEARTTRL